MDLTVRVLGSSNQPVTKRADDEGHCDFDLITLLSGQPSNMLLAPSREFPSRLQVIRGRQIGNRSLKFVAADAR